MPGPLPRRVATIFLIITSSNCHLHDGCLLTSILLVVIGATRCVVETGVFETVPASGSTGIQELAKKYEADEALISLFHPSVVEEYLGHC